MPLLHESLAGLRIFGDDLVPKGETWRDTPTGREYSAKTGAWHLDAAMCQPGDLDGQVAEILGKLTSDLEVWRSLTRRFRIDLFCGWFMEQRNEGISISPKTMAALAERGIELDICLYGPSKQP